ncbi:zinc finger protein 418-like isoform X5 [Ceratina calcarata]|uniref:Zinc finger protein 418-like isoform X5 n=1 Tax=Ceratina calcarata TaxID=156304 RepID=A0AAJ7S3S0_9HYME|nr:zinc finger protein 418-like isoform X5 [Ceratina calcarata]
MICRMESEGSIAVSLDACRGDSILIETVKDMVNETSHTELENEEESFFVVSNVQSEQQNVMDVSNDETAAIQSNEQFSWSTLCRVCANTSDHLIPIFEGEGSQHDLCNKIHKYLPIHISEDDTLPLQLCYHCAATLLAWHELLEGCLSAERRLLEMYDESLDKQSSKELETSLQDTSISIAESFQQQQETVKAEVPEEITVIDSGRCDAKHENESNDNERTERLPKSDLNEESEAALKVCKKRLKQSSQQRDELARSKIAWNGSTYYKCRDCKKTLSTSYNFLIHRNIHTGERPYTCHCCDKSFCSPSALNRHVSDVHAGVKKFACDMCDRRLASRASRDEHRRTHTGEKLHVCEQCGKSFKQKASLHVHKSFHLKVHPYECSWCKRCFKRKQELDKHVFIHTEQKPYPCDVCGKHFRSKGCVSRHKRVHGGSLARTKVRTRRRYR